MRTIEMIVPAFERENIEAIVRKAKKHLPTVSVSFSAPYKKIFAHAIIDNAHGLFDNKFKKVCHTVIDMTLNLPEINGWFLKATYENGIPHITDMTKPLDIKVDGHGATYNRCDSCGHKAWAKSYLIENSETGVELQVGSECLKSFHITELSWVYKLTHTLYEIYDYTTDERCPDPDGFPMWRYKADPAATMTVRVADCIRSAKLYYDKQQGKWEGGYYDSIGYVKSRSNSELQELIHAGQYSEVATDDYVASVLEYVKNEIEPNVEYDPYGSTFNWDMCQALKNYYCSIADSSYAFFAIKKYEQWLAAQRLSKVEKGQFIHVIGIVVSHKIVDGIYGSYDCFEIKANSGHTIRRNGKIATTKSDDGFERAEFFAEVEYVHKNGTLSIGRATKKPKKGIEYINL